MSNIDTLPLEFLLSVKSRPTGEGKIFSRRPGESEIPCELRTKESAPGGTRTPDLLIRSKTPILHCNHQPMKSP